MNTETTINIVQSKSKAKDILENIAVAGKYKASGFNNGFVIYSKEKGDTIEEVTAKKVSGRKFEVFRRTVSM